MTQARAMVRRKHIVPITARVAGREMEQCLYGSVSQTLLASTEIINTVCYEHQYGSLSEYV